MQHIDNLDGKFISNKENTRHVHMQHDINIQRPHQNDLNDQSINNKRRNYLIKEFDIFNRDQSQSKWTTSDTKIEADLRPGNVQCIRIDHVAILESDKEHISKIEFENIVGTRIREKHLAHHFKTYLHQDGVADLSRTITAPILIESTGRATYCEKLGNDLINEADNSVTLIECILILDRTFENLDESLPIAIGKTTSRAYFDKNTKKVIHDFENDVIYVLSDIDINGNALQLFDSSFDDKNRGKNDRNVYNRIGKFPAEVFHEIN